MRVDIRVVLLLTGFSILPRIGFTQPDHSVTRIHDPEYHQGNPGRPEIVYYNSTGATVKASTDPSGLYCRLQIPGHHYTSEPGQPELPVLSFIVRADVGERVSVRLSDIKSTTLYLSDNNMKGREIYPSQPGRTKNSLPDEKVVVRDRKLYRHRGVIQHDTVVISKIGMFRGIELFNIAVYPAFYNPKAGSIDLINTMNVEISYQTGGDEIEENPISSSPVSEKNDKLFLTGFSDRPAGLVIITDPVFSKALAPYIHWKTIKGFDVRVIYRGEGSPETVYAALKDSLVNVYNEGLAGGNPPQYLLIAGDPSIIPLSKETTAVSDMYYAEFDGDGDFIPEMFVGRLPVKDTTRLKGVISKIISYETFSFSPADDFWSRALVTAGNDAGYAKFMNGQVNYIYGNYLNTDPFLDPLKWNYPESYTKDDSLKTVVSNGLGILNYTGHGETSGFSDPSLKVADIGGLSVNNGYPFVIANACRTAQINVSPCFGSELLSVPDKGAIGYIGCTNDSFWSEDFYWAVGTGSPGLDATYLNTGLGAFDRLYHTHNETPGEWYYTMGQVNFAGNMAVSESTSSKKKYYWETYILLGDPSLMPYTSKPDTFIIELPDTLPQALTNLSFFTRPFAYAAISDFENLLDARNASPSGNVTLSLPSGVKDSCLLVLTGQNMVPLMKTLYFGTLTDEFLTVKNVTYNDSEGNGNNTPDYGERIYLNLDVSNLGLTDATNLTVNLAVSSGDVSIEQGSVNIGTLAGLNSAVINNQLIFNIAGDIADGALASLLLTLTDDKRVYLFGIDMTIAAPEVRIISSVPNDINTGDADFLPDPGETVMLDIKVTNSGSSVISGVLTVEDTSPLLMMQDYTLATGPLLPGSVNTVGFEARISPLAGAGAIIPFSVMLDCESYGDSASYSLAVGKTRETWEHSRFDVFPWINSGANPWTITKAVSYENIQSARSGLISDSHESLLAITVNNPERDTLSFFVRVSSEEDYDDFIFRIDSSENLRVSGELPWAERRVVLEPGIHYLEWVYKKDYSQTGGFDAVWLDMITFPDIAFLEADLKVDTVFSPPDTTALNNVVIKGRVINLGRNTLTSFPLAYRINSQDQVTETFYEKLDPGDTAEVAFTQHCTFHTDIDYRIAIINRLPEDGYSGNDTATVNFLKEGSEYYGQMFVYPSPFNDELFVIYDAPDDGIVTVEMTDMPGRTVLKRQEAVTQGLNEIYLKCQGMFSRGLYTVTMRQGSHRVSRKVVKGR